jgi:hypothetical protein
VDGVTYVVGDLEALARRVYELHQARDVKRGGGRVLSWYELPEAERSELIAGTWRVLVAYEADRPMPREVRIER